MPENPRRDNQAGLVGATIQRLFSIDQRSDAGSGLHQTQQVRGELIRFGGERVGGLHTCVLNKVPCLEAEMLDKGLGGSRGLSCLRSEYSRSRYAAF